MKKILLIIIALAVIGGVAYFITNKESQEEGLKNIISERNQARVSQYENLPTGTLEDLVVGEEVMVRGATNSDGSITAEMIFIGEFEMMANVRPNRSMPEGFNMERMQEFRANSGNSHMSGMGGMMTGNAAFIRGEIINKDEVSITVKLVDSGSRLIFYSDDTQILKRKE